MSRTNSFSFRKNKTKTKNSKAVSQFFSAYEGDERISEVFRIGIFFFLIIDCISRQKPSLCEERNSKLNSRELGRRVIAISFSLFLSFFFHIPREAMQGKNPISFLMGIIQITALRSLQVLMVSEGSALTALEFGFSLPIKRECISLPPPERCSSPIIPPKCYNTNSLRQDIQLALNQILKGNVLTFSFFCLHQPSVCIQTGLLLNCIEIQGSNLNYKVSISWYRVLSNLELSSELHKCKAYFLRDKSSRKNDS